MTRPIGHKKQQIMKHCADLRKIFPAITADDEALISVLNHLEKRAHKLAEDYCNRPLPPRYYERNENDIMTELDKLIHYKDAKVKVFLNGDPRGYALKISDADMRAKEFLLWHDWGGYGILAPDFSES